jgi:hypothetical protein
MTMEGAWALASTDLNEFHMESIVDYEDKDPKKWKFRVRWLGYMPATKTILR